MHITALAPPPTPFAPAIHIPLIAPNPPRLSAQGAALAEIEQSGRFSNFGPVNTRFEAEMIATMFRGTGACLTVANATLGLMLSVRQAIGWRPRGKYALMPSFTFTATAQAAIWCGLTPLFCDIERDSWLPSAGAEEELVRRHGDDIAVLMPNATYGNCLDLARYQRLSAQTGIPLVVDAAAGLGAVQADGRAFGHGSPDPVVFSMHATKCFATGEGGLIYCSDQARIAELRRMAGFGLDAAKLTIMPGLNAKLSEVAALQALEKLHEIDTVTKHRFAAQKYYEQLLPGFAFQRVTGQRSALQFASLLLPPALAPHRPAIIEAMASHGIGAGHYFAPHLAEHPFFKEMALAGDLSGADEVSRRMVSLPMSDMITRAQVREVCAVFSKVCGEIDA